MNIFLSYNRKNKSFVEEIAERLKSFHIGVSDNLFFDQEKLESGDVWASKIQEALVNSDACVVFVGEQGIGGWQNKEVLKAISLLENKETNFRIIPVIVPHSNRETILKSFPWFLADVQWIEFSSFSDSDAFQNLVKTIRNDREIFPVPADVSPYKGLEFFDVDDAAFFFGRGPEINRVFNYNLQVSSDLSDKRFVAIVGSSGSGKSSFVRAGILASLKAGRFEGSSDWIQLVITPEDNPLLRLSAALEKAGLIEPTFNFKEAALHDPETLRYCLESSRMLSDSGKKLVLLIDQFEEVITQCKDNTIRAAFLANLAEAVKSKHLVCLTAMRSDFYASFAPYREFNLLLTSNNSTLSEIDADTSGDEWRRSIRDIILKPAGLLGVSFDSALVAQLIEDLEGINGALPALQLALQQLWLTRKKEDRIVSEDYDRLARGRGIAGVIEEHANKVYNLLTADGSDIQKVTLFKAIFIRLVEITSGKEDVRKTVKRTNLINELDAQFKNDDIEAMLVKLSGEESRLIRVKNDINGEAWVDIIHEVLIRKWQKLKGWINERRDAFAYKQIIEKDISQYERKQGDLYSGRDLKTALIWQKANLDLSDERTTLFIKKSQGRQRTIVSALLTILLLGIGVWWYYESIYFPAHSGFANYWKERNYELEEVHKLHRITNLDELRNLYVFSNLDSVEIDANKQNFNQTCVAGLPKHIRYISIINAEIDQDINFDGLDSLKGLSLSSISKIQSLSLLKGINSLQTLTLYNLTNLQNLSGLQAMPKLQNLTLTYLTKLQSLSGLQSTPNLHTLTLTYLANLRNLSGLQAMPNLHSLALFGLTNLQNLSGLQATPDLYTLRLSDLAIADLSGLQATPKLQNLTLYNLANLQYLSGLQATPRLQNLALMDLTNLQNLSGLQATPNLHTLWLSNLAIADLSGLQATPKLQNLTLIKLTKLQNLSGLQATPNLHTLRLWDLAISDLSGLQATPKLQNLTLTHLANLRNLSGLQAMPNLHTLTLDNLDKLQNLSGLQATPKLRTLMLTELTKLQNLSGLQPMPKLQNLTLTYLTKLQNLSGLQAMPNLRTLALYNLTNLQNLNGLQATPRLRDLTLSGLDELQSLSGLQAMPKLQNLTLTGLTKLQSLGGLEHLSKLKKLSLFHFSTQQPSYSQGIFILPLDTLVFSESAIDIIDFRNKPWKIKVLVYTEVGDDKIVEIARQHTQTKFLNKPKE